MSRGQFLKGWDVIGNGRQMRNAYTHTLYVTKTAGGLFLAEIIPKDERKAERYAVKATAVAARQWCEETAGVGTQWWRREA